MSRSFTYTGVAAACASLLVLTGCGSSSPSASKDTVSVDIGAGKKIDLPQGKLKVGLFYQGDNAFNQSIEKTAKAKAKEYGWDLTVLNPNFDLNTQLDQMQTAATKHSFDAVIVQPIVAASACNVMTKTLPAANVLTITIGTPCQTNLKEAGPDQWAPGTLTTVAGDTTITYARRFLELAAEKYTGPQKVAFITGPGADPLVIAQKKVVAEMKKTNPDFDVQLVNGEWATPAAYSATQNYLQGHKDTTLVLSAYSPDVSRGVVTALKSVGELGKIPVADQGGTTYSVEQIKAGAIDFTLPYFPENYGTNAMQALHDAQQGNKVERFISVIPESFGTVSTAKAVDKTNVDTFTPAS